MCCALWLCIIWDAKKAERCHGIVIPTQHLLEIKAKPQPDNPGPQVHNRERSATISVTQWLSTGTTLAAPPPPGSFCQCLKTLLVVYWHLVGRKQESLNILQCTRQLPTAENYLAPTVKSVQLIKIKKNLKKEVKKKRVQDLETLVQ